MSQQETCQPGTVLVIDDDGRTVKTCRIILEHAGHTVLEAGEGDGGMYQLQEHPQAVDVVIMDWIMPGLDGHHWIKPMLDFDANLQIIFCTGHELNEPTQRLIEARAHGFIQKPIDPKRLLALVDECLVRRRAATAPEAGA